MKIQYLSDLHLDFEPRNRDWPALVENIPVVGDVLVLAGDFAEIHFKHYKAALQRLCARWPHVVMVAGNNEYYSASYSDVAAMRQEAQGCIGNLHWLEDAVAVIEGQRFVGCTLWFRKEAENKRYERFLGDFDAIEDFREWVYRVNTESRTFLTERVRESDVVVTHHLPHPGSVAHKFKNSPLNRFFLCDMRPLMQAAQPALWIHGHTHTPALYREGVTQVACNPWGYPGESLPVTRAVTI